MRTAWLDLDRVQRIAVERGTRSRPEESLTSLQGGASVGTPWLPEEDKGRSPLSEIRLSIYLSNNNSGPFKNIMRYIFIKKKYFVRHYLSLCFHLYLYYGYTTRTYIYIYILSKLNPSLLPRSNKQLSRKHNNLVGLPAMSSMCWSYRYSRLPNSKPNCVHRSNSTHLFSLVILLDREKLILFAPFLQAFFFSFLFFSFFSFLIIFSLLFAFLLFLFFSFPSFLFFFSFSFLFFSFPPFCISFSHLPKCCISHMLM